MSCDVMWKDIIWCNITLWDVMWYVMWCDVITWWNGINCDGMWNEMQYVWNECDKMWWNVKCDGCPWKFECPWKCECCHISNVL